VGLASPTAVGSTPTVGLASPTAVGSTPTVGLGSRIRIGLGTNRILTVNILLIDHVSFQTRKVLVQGEVKGVLACMRFDVDVCLFFIPSGGLSFSYSDRFGNRQYPITNRPCFFLHQKSDCGE
jgi:hypothetical protein